MTKITFNEAHKIASILSYKFHKSCPWISKDDFYQETWVAMLRATKTYDGTKGSLESYLYNYAWTKLCDYVAAFRIPITGYYKILSKMLLLEIVQTGQISDKENSNPETIVIINQALNTILGELTSKLKLSDEKSKLMLMLLGGEYRAREVAEIMEVDVSRVYEIKRYIKEKLINSKKLRKQCEV